jgi:hypothetical protein
MRHFTLEISGDFGACCGVEAIHGFPSLATYDQAARTYITDDKTVTDEEWLEALYGEPDDYWGDGECNFQPDAVAFYTFTNASDQKGAATPTLFAQWLRRKGETVFAGRPEVNPKTKNQITLYVWHPSEKFVKMWKEYENKKNNESDSESDD